MKHFIAIAFVLLCSQAASADTMLRFKDGTAWVWDNIYTKGADYCTEKEYGELCAPKNTVASIKEVPAGTEASEYGMSVVEVDESVESRKQANSEATSAIVGDMERQKKQRDAEYDRQQKKRESQVRMYGEKAVAKKERDRYSLIK